MVGTNVPIWQNISNTLQLSRWGIFFLKYNSSSLLGNPPTLVGLGDCDVHVLLRVVFLLV